MLDEEGSMMDRGLDYRDLLKKYVRTIGDAEGYLYLDYGDFTDEEEAEIIALSKEAYEEELAELEKDKTLCTNCGGKGLISSAGGDYLPCYLCKEGPTDEELEDWDWAKEPNQDDYLACDMCTVNIDTGITKHPDCKTHADLITAEEFLGQEPRKRCHCSAGPGWCRCE